MLHGLPWVACVAIVVAPAGFLLSPHFTQTMRAGPLFGPVVMLAPFAAMALSRLALEALRGAK